MRDQVSKNTTGIAMIASVIIIIIIVAALGLGTYYYLSTTSGSKTTTSSPITSSTTFQTTTTSLPTSSQTTIVSSTTQGLTNTTTISTGSTTSIACATTFTSGVYNQTKLPNFTPLFSNFSAMVIKMVTSSGGVNTTLESSYKVESVSGSGLSAVYTVTVNETSAGNVFSGVATYDGNGTVQSIAYSSIKITGTAALALFSGWMAPFALELSAESTYQAYLSSPNIAQVNQTKVTIGQSSVNVTNYRASNTPFSISYCGLTTTINNLMLQIGQVEGSTYGSIVTYQIFNGTSQGTTFNFQLRVISITKA